MNEATALRILRNQIRLLNLGDDLTRRLRPIIRRTYREVAAQVAAWDDLPLTRRTLFKRARWLQLEGQLAAILEPLNSAVYQELVTSTAAEIPRQVLDAERQLLNAGMTPYQRADSLSPGLGEVTEPAGFRIAINSAVGASPPIRLGEILNGAPISASQLVRAAKGTRYLQADLDSLFNVLDPPQRPPRYLGEYAPPYIRRNIRIIDETVAKGFLVGETNEEIAQNLMTKGVGRAVAEARTIARTAVLQMSDDAHQAFYDANIDEIEGWEYDASMDYMVCAACAPWDGRVARSRADLPTLKQHPNCRCVISPLDRVMMRLRESQGPKGRTVVELIPKRRGEPRPKNGEDFRYYSRPVTIDGRTYWRRAKELGPKDGAPASMADFLAQSNIATQRQILGSYQRVAEYRQDLAEGRTPNSALVRATHDQRKWPSVVERGRGANKDLRKAPLYKPRRR